MRQPNRYSQIIERIFFSHYTEGALEVPFERADIERAASALGISLPKNLGDLIYSFRYRASLPASVQARAPAGETWLIRADGRSRYKFVAERHVPIVPNTLLGHIKVPDATPGIIARYRLNDEQALLAKLRYNRLIDVFTGITCYSLQSHLRTTVPNLGQVETDEIYLGIDRHGVHHVLPVQAKGGHDSQSIVQIEQDFAVCAHKFPALPCHAIAAQFMRDDVIALFQFEQTSERIELVTERHYRLVLPDQISDDDLLRYQQQLPR
jgi:hypothetical protein